MAIGSKVRTTYIILSLRLLFSTILSIPPSHQDINMQSAPVLTRTRSTRILYLEDCKNGLIFTELKEILSKTRRICLYQTSFTVPMKIGAIVSRSTIAYANGLSQITWRNSLVTGSAPAQCRVTTVTAAAFVPLLSTSMCVL